MKFTKRKLVTLLLALIALVAFIFLLHLDWCGRPAITSYYTNSESNRVIVDELPSFLAGDVDVDQVEWSGIDGLNIALASTVSDLGSLNDPAVKTLLSSRDPADGFLFLVRLSATQIAANTAEFAVLDGEDTMCLSSIRLPDGREVCLWITRDANAKIQQYLASSGQREVLFYQNWTPLTVSESLGPLAASELKASRAFQQWLHLPWNEALDRVQICLVVGLDSAAFLACMVGLSTSRSNLSRRDGER